MIGSEAYCKQVGIARIPTQRSYMLLLRLFVAEFPNWQQIAFAFNGLLFAPIILVIIVLWQLLVLSDNAFHYFQAFLKSGGIQRLFLLLFLVVFVLLVHISIENYPLIHFSFAIFLHWRQRRHSLFSQIAINSLCLVVIIIKLVSQSSLNCTLLLFC